MQQSLNPWITSPAADSADEEAPDEEPVDVALD